MALTPDQIRHVLQHGTVVTKRAMSAQQILDRAYAALGYQPDDESDEATCAQTWVAATFDNDMAWLENSTPAVIRRSYEQWKREVKS